ncbi:response regulator [Actinomadura sp. ATCC 39365]
MTPQQAASTMNGDTRTKPVLLIADPDDAVVDDLVTALEREGVAVTGAPDGAQGLLQAGALQPDVVLVSATLPVIDAVDFVRAVRLARAVPVLLGVGEGNAEQAVRALAAGAAACVARPYRVPELLPFIQAASPSPARCWPSAASNWTSRPTRYASRAAPCTSRCASSSCCST